MSRYRMSDGTLLSDQAFEEWYNCLTKYSIRYDTALAGWQACAQRNARTVGLRSAKKSWRT